MLQELLLTRTGSWLTVRAATMAMDMVGYGRRRCLAVNMLNFVTTLFVLELCLEIKNNKRC